jgi:hypothetical protein
MHRLCLIKGLQLLKDVSRGTSFIEHSKSHLHRDFKLPNRAGMKRPSYNAIGSFQELNGASVQCGMSLAKDLTSQSGGTLN